MKKQLELNRETVRNLDRTGLMEVEGGIVWTTLASPVSSIVLTHTVLTTYTKTAPKDEPAGTSGEKKPEQPQGSKAVPI